MAAIGAAAISLPASVVGHEDSTLLVRLGVLRLLGSWGARTRLEASGPASAGISLS